MNISQEKYHRKPDDASRVSSSLSSSILPSRWSGCGIHHYSWSSSLPPILLLSWPSKPPKYDNRHHENDRHVSDGPEWSDERGRHDASNAVLLHNSPGSEEGANADTSWQWSRFLWKDSSLQSKQQLFSMMNRYPQSDSNTTEGQILAKELNGARWEEEDGNRNQTSTNTDKYSYRPLDTQFSVFKMIFFLSRCLDGRHKLVSRGSHCGRLACKNYLVDWFALWH